MMEQEIRNKIVTEAKSWIGTPYHPNAQVKGAGCSCATFIYAVMLECGLVPEEKIGNYSNDWFLHIREDIYTKRLMRLLRYTSEPRSAVTYRNTPILPGSILLLKAAGARYNNHGGIVTQWPYLIHGIHPDVHEIDASRDPMWMFRQVLVFDPTLNKI